MTTNKENKQKEKESAKQVDERFVCKTFEWTERQTEIDKEDY